MKKLVSLVMILAVITVANAAFGVEAQTGEITDKRWSVKKAQAWYDEQPWLIGCNFMPSNSINQLEMWQADTFDPETIDRELGWAAGIGFNVVRVFLHDLAYEQDPKGFLKRVDQFLEIADKHDIKPMIVFFDDCWLAEPKIGKQPEPIPGVIGSGWLESPGLEELKRYPTDAKLRGRLEKYVTAVIDRFKDDTRVLMWDMYNEPGGAWYKRPVGGAKYQQGFTGGLCLPLLKDAYIWARRINPSQPLTSCSYGNTNSQESSLKWADVTTFHHYGLPASLESTIVTLQEASPDRPIICTEYLMRPGGDTFQASLPVLCKYNIGAVNWGLVDGKVNAKWGWASWNNPDPTEPKVWFHNVLRKDGTPYDPAEIVTIKQHIENEYVEPAIEVIVPTSFTTPESWTYSLTKPEGDWTKPEFDDSKWTKASGGFGISEIASRRARTEWTTKEIWIRRSFELDRTDFNQLALDIHYDENPTVYINGILVSQLSGYNIDYTVVELDDRASKAIKLGKNVLTVHATQTTGGQYIDVGLVDIVHQHKSKTFGADPDAYMRHRLLSPHLSKIKRIVFTKHFDMGGSHYAYTDAVSDEDTLNPNGFVKQFYFKGGSSLCLLEVSKDLTIKETSLLQDEDGVIRDPDVSYDGKRILFSWKKSARGDDYHLYEMDFETKKVRQLTFGKGVADYEGVYLPNGDIMFSSTRCFQNVDCWHVSVSNMFIMNKDGKHMRRVGFDQVNTNYPQVHPQSGLVTYTRWEYNDRGQIYPQPLFRMFPNGAQQTEFYGNNSYFPTSILHARGIPGTGKVLAVLSGHHTHQRGKLAIIDPSKGRQETSGVTLVAPVKQLKGIIKIDKYGQQGDQWQYPYPLDEDNYLVTFWTDGQKHFGIYFMNSKGERVLLASDPAVSCNQPIPLVPRPLPPQIAYPTDWRKETGTYTIQDIYHGPGLKGIARGTVKKIRVVALDFMATDIGRLNGPSPISINAAWDVKIVLGESPVYEDGSAAFQVPARTPVYFQAIDAKGHVVQTMRSWSTLMPGEVFGCIGCHESKNDAVPNKLTTIAMKKGVKKLDPFYDVSGKGFSFPKMIQPILDAKCVECHKGGDTNPPDLRATPVWDTKALKFWNQAYHVLISTDRSDYQANDAGQILGLIAEKSKYLNWISRWSVPTMIPPYSHGSSQSPLIALLAKGHEKVKMTQEEMDKIACWIDLALPHSGSWTEGMKPEDKEIYMRVYNKRIEWEKQEAQNIQEYITTQSKN